MVLAGLSSPVVAVQLGAARGSFRRPDAPAEPLREIIGGSVSESCPEFFDV
jgi:hypothetical protein